MLAQLLKSETRAAHHVLDHHPLLMQLFKPDLSVDTYALILSSMRDVQVYCENTLAVAAKNISHHQYLDSQSRIPLLNDDLRRLPYLPTIFQSIVDPITVNNMGAFIGMAYVIEGSALGGQHIARYLQKTNPQLPIQFFSSAGFDCKQRWELFLDFARSSCPQDQYENAVTSAVKTFEIYRRHMDRCLDKNASNSVTL